MRTFREPGSDFHSLIFHPAIELLEESEFTGSQVGVGAAKSSFEGTPILEHTPHMLSSIWIAIHQAQQAHLFALLGKLAGHLKNNDAAGGMSYKMVGTRWLEGANLLHVAGCKI